MKTPKFNPLTAQESADVESAMNAIYKQSTKVPFKPFKEQPDSSPINNDKSP